MAAEPLATLCPEPLEVGPAPSTRWLREQELELRALLLRDAQDDDGAENRTERQYGNDGLWLCKEGVMWPTGQALDEIRLVERRLHQMGEDK